MFEVNGIAYASEKSNKISITDAKVTDHLMMIVTFSGGEKRVFDASVLTGSAFKPLEDDAIFSNFINLYITHYSELQANSIQHHDLTELHKDRLTLLGQMTSSFVHEFRNPLTSIKGFVQLLKAEQPELPYLDIILTELEQLNSRISQFLLVSRKEGIQALPTVFPINELINEIITFIYPSIVDNNASIEANIETNFTIYGHRDEIRQVLLNIILNAVDVLTSSKDPRITIYGHQEANDNILEIINNGPEIKKEMIDDIFKPFITTKESGTGLGLFVSKEIIEKHNGTITCSSTKNHTNFTIILPKMEKSIQQ